MTITVLRYSAATTKTELLEEIANADSRDHGIGGSYGGLCVALKSGSIDVDVLIPAEVKRRCAPHNLHLDYQDSASGLVATLHTGSAIKPRTMWQMDVAAADIIGLADRYVPEMVPVYYVDGLVLRRGAVVSKVRKVRSQR